MRARTRLRDRRRPSPGPLVPDASSGEPPAARWWEPATVSEAPLPMTGVPTAVIVTVSVALVVSGTAPTALTYRRGLA